MRKEGKIVYIIAFFVLTFFVQDVYSQRNPPNLMDYDYSKRRFRFGFCLGANYATFTSVPNPNLSPFDSLLIVEPTGKGGFDVGISVNFRLNEFLDLKFVPNLSMLSRSMDYTWKYPGNTVYPPMSKVIESINVDLPFFVKLKSQRIANNMRFFVLSGGQYSYDMMSNSKKRNAFGDKLKLKPNDIQVLAGAGMEFYLPYFKISIEGKMGYGIANLLTQENNTISLSIEKLHSKTFHFVIILE